MGQEGAEDSLPVRRTFFVHGQGTVDPYSFQDNEEPTADSKYYEQTSPHNGSMVAVAGITFLGFTLFILGGVGGAIMALVWERQRNSEMPSGKHSVIMSMYRSGRSRLDC